MSRPAALLVVAILAAPAAADDGAKFFEEKVHPVLKRHCYACHSHAAKKMKGGLALDSKSGWEAGGESGPAVVPGKPDESLLVKAVRYGDDRLQMPPKGKLPAAELELLVEWVRRGAPDPRKVAPKPGGETWWSLKPLAKPPVPELRNPQSAIRNPIDAFVRAKLAEKGLAMAPEADRRTLIRRLTFDLHGLPPTPEEVATFEADPSPDAYGRLVDRLLASPRYGERWARHWLDVIHFAETHGTEHDLIRPNAWRYRDYVIGRLNADVPYGRFIREQLAADVFSPDEPRLTAALGFLAAGPWDQSTADTAPKTFDYLDRDDMVTQVMATFASTTVHCARCHDHKFDPIPQEDYYALQAVFAGVGRGDVAYDEDPAVHRKRKKWELLAAAADKQDRAVLLGSEARAIADEWAKGFGGAAADWRVLEPETFLSANGATLRRQPDGSFLAAGAAPATDTYTLTTSLPLRGITAVRLEVLPDNSLPAGGPGRAENGNLHLSEFEVLLFAPGASEGKKLRVKRATADFDQAGWTVAHAIDGNEQTAWGVHPEEGKPHEAVFELAEKLTVPEGGRLAVVLRQAHGRGHTIGRFRLSATGDPPARAAVVPATVREALAITPDRRTEAQRLTLAAYAVRRRAEQEIAALPDPLKVYAASAHFLPFDKFKPWPTPKPVHVLKRGDINKPGPLAAPGALTAVAELPGRFALPNPDDEAARRAALADWLADPRNPLTWRSIANRVWQHHFGRGIVDTPNDLGRMGGAPSHPELLDWLACELRDNGQSLKKLHKLIVTSAAYRQAVRPDDRSAKLDADNRLLWRQNRRRLDAESVRDAVLSVSGRLDLTMGGPSVRQFKLSKGNFTTPNVDYAAFDWDSPGAGRRSVYRFIFRTLPDPFLDALDFPDASQLSPTRPFSASALQALALYNNEFVLRHAEHFAARLGKLAADPPGQVREAFRLALLREPTAGELERFAAYTRKHGTAAMCRVLFNSNEFLFVD
jgi:mono/diheme cytochrome c family protein